MQGCEKPLYLLAIKMFSLYLYLGFLSYFQLKYDDKAEKCVYAKVNIIFCEFYNSILNGRIVLKG